MGGVGLLISRAARYHVFLVEGPWNGDGAGIKLSGFMVYLENKTVESAPRSAEPRGADR